MVTNKTYEYGIRYKVSKVGEDKYLLIPVALEGGLSDGIDFSTDEGVYPICYTQANLKKKYVMDNVYTTDDLEEMYEYSEDTDFLSSYFYDEYKDTVILVVVDKENDRLQKHYIDLKDFIEREYDFTYFMDGKNNPAITLNGDALDEILDADDYHSMRVLLQKYRELLTSFSEYNANKGVTRIEVNDGKVVAFDSEKKVVKEKDNGGMEAKKTVPFGGVDVSYVGLRNAIKERVFGHDEEIDTIAQKLYLNYTAQEGESVDSILIVGPTGTGKTETVKAASEYLYVPYFEVNASNLVPQGIKGMSIEDVVIGLYEESGRDLKRAQKGLAFFDEYDKLPDSDLDIKLVIKNILLSFNDGGKVPIKDETYDFIFDSKMTSKIYAGVFERISGKKGSIGFGARDEEEKLGTESEIRRKIIDANYYSLEDLSRISTVLGYNELSRETKRQILLSSKLSEFAKKRARYKRQFGIDLSVTEDYIDAILDQISNDSTGMRSVNNFVKRSIDTAERSLLENERKGYKRLVLTKDTVSDPKKFDIL